MKRGLILLLVFLVFSVSLISSQEVNETENLEKAYQCIRDKIGNSCSSLTSEQQSFSILALGDFEDCEEIFLSNSRNISSTQTCWPSQNCNPKETALAVLALDRLRIDSPEAENWLLNQTKTASELIWILQVESESSTSCSASYSTGSYDFLLNEDKTISKDAGPCLKRTQQNYWFGIERSESCINEEFSITCNEDFKTNLLYKSEDSPTIHVSRNVHQESAQGTTKEKINFKCFKKGTVCDYESSLWATLVLDFKGYDVTNYLPFLEASADQNSRLFPEAFLYQITRSDDYLTPILSTRFNGQFWSAGGGNKFYDTALALLSIQNQGLSQADQAKRYLLSNNIQDQDGCWGTLEDTSFLLYSGWPLIDSEGNIPNECSDDDDCGIDEQCIDGFCEETSTTDFDCELSGNFCVESRYVCSLPVADGGAGGQVLNNFDCQFSSEVCCSKNYIPQQETCADLNGIICAQGLECPFGQEIFNAVDSGICCLTTCELPSQEETECDEAGYSCRSGGCFEDEEEVLSYSCNSGEFCCQPSTTPEPGFNFWWIVIILIVMIIVVLAVIFRKRVQLWWFKFRSGFKSKSPDVKPSRPTFPPRPLPRPIPPRQFPPRPQNSQFPQTRPRPNSRDQEFEDTLKKLRDMSG